ncbi:MAG: TolC family protein [Lachnospiraceae bacterium]|nr:TolC family protein [Lachnospiraceae bacterium]
MMHTGYSKKIKKKIAASVISLALAFIMLFSDLSAFKVEAAQGKKITLRACRSLAIQDSLDYENAEDAIESKKAEYESAVKAIALKQKSMSQFRWSPLLNFQFPTSPDLAEASEFQYKPVAIQYDIKVAQHNLQDNTYEISEMVNNLYVEIVVLQETIAFNERRAEGLEDGLKRNQARQRIGEATKSDVEKIEKKLDSVNKKIASDRRTLEADLKKMSNMVGMDISTGYTFERPFLEAEISRDQLDALIEYTEDRDETYYEACIAESTARAELNTNFGLVKSKFGRDANQLSSYVNSAFNGNRINKRAFKNDYKAFLEKIDSYWQGKKRIFLFVKVPRLWFKGDKDGTRYIDDDPYVLYQNVLDYASSAKEKEEARETLDQTVTDTFNSYVSVKNAYKQCISDLDKADKELTEAELKNRLGELTFDEYDSQMDSYEELQNSMLDNMKLYSQTLYSFDRLTCGGISAILSGTDADMQTAVVGTSYVEKITADGAYYSIASIIQSMEFELRLTIPDDFETDITDYELWINNIQVGDRTPKDKKLRHLKLDFDNNATVKIRLYNDTEFVDDCYIDPSVEAGPLEITTGYDIKKDEGNILGTYEIDVNDTTQLIDLKIKADDEAVKSFVIKTKEGKALGSENKIDISKTLRHLDLMQQSLEDLQIELYDESGSLLYTGRFDTLNVLIRKLEE